MLSVNKYTRDYIDDCRRQVDAQLSAYNKLVTAARKGAKTNGAALDAAVDAFDVVFFRNLVVVLDTAFVHRTRALEGKDGNPLNEVRMVCNSVLQNDGVMSADKTIKYKAPESVLHCEVGDEIRLSAADFRLLADAFFAEIEKKYL